VRLARLVMTISGIDGDIIVSMIGERRRSTSISSVSRCSSA
jgi:hypothetical protein